MNEIKTKWYGWIPTNRGKINFRFIGLIPVSTIKDRRRINDDEAFIIIMGSI